MKLFVWEGILTDWSNGIMFALAPNLREAKKAILKKSGVYKSSWLKEELNSIKPRVIKDTEGFYLYGGS